MSTVTKQLAAECGVGEACGAIELIIETRDEDLGGFSVRRALPVARRAMVGPWVFFDHVGPTGFPAGTGIGVRPHPHVNIATVTYRKDRIERAKRDCKDGRFPKVPGDEVEIIPLPG